MTAHQLRTTLRRLRAERDWTLEELAQDIRRVNGLGIVSTTTTRNFLSGSKVTPRIEAAFRAYVEQHEAAPVARAS